MSWGTELWVSAGPRNGPRGGGSGPGLHRAEITEQTNEPRRAALRSGGGLGCFIFWCVCVCAVWRWAPTEGVRFQEGAAGRGAEGSLGTARCGEGSGGGGAVRLREERERREPPAGAGWSGAGGGAGLGAVLCAELREAEGKYGLGHKEDAVQPCLAARSAARCAGRGAKERPDGGGAPR